MHAAVSTAGETVVELIETNLGPNIYEGHLEAHGEGLHPIKADWNAEAIRAAVEAFIDARIEILQQGSTLAGSSGTLIRTMSPQE